MNELGSSDTCNVSTAPSGIPFLITNYVAYITRWALKFLVWYVVCMLGLTEFPIDHLILHAANIRDAKQACQKIRLRII
jgi:hypothetical protein